LPDGPAVPAAIVDELAGRLAAAVNRAREDADLARDPEAADLWRQIYMHLSTPRPGLVGAVLGRAEAQVARLAGVYAALDGSHLIRRVHLQAALAVWDYVDQSAVYIFGQRLGDPVADEALDAIRAAGSEGLTETELHRHFGNHLKAGRLGVALQSLASLRLIYPVTDKTGGRARTRWVCTQDGCERSEGSE
jgi:hypothetical protein